MNMKTAEDVKAFIEYRDIQHKELRGGVMMYDVKDQHKWLTESELLQHWIDHVYQPPHPTSLPSDEEIALKAGERLLRLTVHDPVQRELTETEKTVSASGYIAGAKDLRSIASARIAEVEREMKEAKQFISDVMNFADGMKVLDGEALRVLKNTARRVLSDKPTQLPKK